MSGKEREIMKAGGQFDGSMGRLLVLGCRRLLQYIAEPNTDCCIESSRKTGFDIHNVVYRQAYIGLCAWMV
jgi:hypothetical protein